MIAARLLHSPSWGAFLGFTRPRAVRRGLLQLRCAHTVQVATPEAVQVEARLTAVAQSIRWAPDMVPRETPAAQLQAFEQHLGHHFSNEWVLRLALIHSSAAPGTNNVQLAWLGDVALQTLVTELLMANLPAGLVGTWAQMRDWLLSRQQCEQHARAIGLERQLIFGPSLQGQISSNMLAEGYEAVLGAVYLDAGLPAVRTVYLKHTRNFNSQQLAEAAKKFAGGSG